MPVFCFDDRLLRGRHASGPRTQFMLESLADLDERLGGTLVFRHGPPERELPALARRRAGHRAALQLGLRARSRAGGSSACAGALREAGVDSLPHPGLHAVDDLDGIRTRTGKPYTVFSPFHRSWLREPRREPVGRPRSLRLAPLAESGRAGSLALRARARAGGRRAAPGRRDGRPRAAVELPALWRARLRGQPRRARRGQDVAAVALPPLRLPLGARARGAAAGAARARTPSGASSAGATSTTTSCSTIRATRAPSSRTATAARSRGAAPGAASRPGATAAPAFRSWTPGCASCGTRVGCTTAPGWWSARS